MSAPTARGRWAALNVEAGPSNYSSRRKEIREDAEGEEEVVVVVLDDMKEERDNDNLAEDDFQHDLIPPPSQNKGKRRWTKAQVGATEMARNSGY
jgi:hypothetical protein